MKKCIIGLARSIIALVVFFGLLLNLPLAQAEEAARFGISPANSNSSTNGYFTLKGQSSQTLREAVTVSNPGNVPVKLKVYPTDASTGEQSGAIYSDSTTAIAEVGTWIKLEKTEVELAPKTQTNIAFTLTIPKDATAGQHLGGIAVQPAQILNSNSASGTTQAGFGITTVTRALTAVLINVGDAATKPSLRIGGAQIAEVDGLSTLTLSLQNNGNALIKPKGEVSLSDATGKIVLNSKLNLDTFVPQTSIAYPVQETLPVVPGTYKVRASLAIENNAPVIYEGTVAILERPTPVANVSRRIPQPVVSNEQMATTSANPPSANVAASNTASGQPQSRESNQPLLFILFGLIAGLVVAVIGMAGFIFSSRKRR